MRYPISILCTALILLGGCDPYPRELGTARETILSAPAGEIALPCVRDGTVAYPPGHALEGELMAPGVDPYGYNYLEHSYIGSFDGLSSGIRGLSPVEDRNTTLRLLWNEAWLSNSDRDGDGRLDRHPGYSTYRGSGAWLTMHLEGMENGTPWVCFLKIAAVPDHAKLYDGTWSVDNAALGPAVWGCFAVIMEFSTSSSGYVLANAFKRNFPGLGLE